MQELSFIEEETKKEVDLIQNERAQRKVLGENLLWEK